MSASDDENPKPTHVTSLTVQHGSLVDILGAPFSLFTKYVKVFDLYFVATATSPDEKLFHGASILHQYIDNDDDGIPDNQLVYTGLVNRKATMIMFADDRELKRNRQFFRANEKCNNILVQDLQADETRPGCLLPFEFDASLEECFHLVTEGYCIAYPEVFGCRRGSAVSAMLDCARGGYFKKVPAKYPDNAWFTYYDRTCDYECMVVEYMYWAMTTILGGQQYRRCEIEKEWRPCTCVELQQYDEAIYKLLTNPVYKFATRLPQPLQCVPLHVVGVAGEKRSDSSSSSGSSGRSGSSGSSSSDENH